MFITNNSNETQSVYVFATQLGSSMNMYKLYNLFDYFILHNYYVMYKYMSVVAIHYETMCMYEKIQFKVHVIYLFVDPSFQRVNIYMYLGVQLNMYIIQINQVSIVKLIIIMM